MRSRAANHRPSSGRARRFTRGSGCLNAPETSSRSTNERSSAAASCPAHSGKPRTVTATPDATVSVSGRRNRLLSCDATTTARRPPSPRRRSRWATMSRSTSESPTFGFAKTSNPWRVRKAIQFRSPPLEVPATLRNTVASRASPSIPWEANHAATAAMSGRSVPVGLRPRISPIRMSTFGASQINRRRRVLASGANTSCRGSICRLLSPHLPERTPAGGGFLRPPGNSRRRLPASERYKRRGLPRWTCVGAGGSLDHPLPSPITRGRRLHVAYARFSLTDGASPAGAAVRGRSPRARGALSAAPVRVHCELRGPRRERHQWVLPLHATMALLELQVRTAGTGVVAADLRHSPVHSIRAGTIAPFSRRVCCELFWLQLIGEENSVQVINFMLEDNCQIAVCLEADRLSSSIKAIDG